MKIPQRPSLVTEVISALREGIQNRRWGNVLPGERTLCKELQVSRPTLSKALKTLEREGVLKTSVKSRRQIVSSTLRKAKMDGRVALLAPIPVEKMESHTVLWLQRLRADMTRLGRELVIHEDPQLFSKNCQRPLEQTFATIEAACWVVPFTTRPMQLWFQEKKLPLIVVGSCFKDINLHSLDFDFRAVGRHAVGMFLSHRHRDLCMVAASDLSAGEKLTELGFIEGSKMHRDGNVRTRIIRHDGTRSAIIRSIQGLLKQEDAPTAYFVSGAHGPLTLISLLAQKQKRLGKDYTLISREDDTFLRYITPGIPFYRRDYEKFAKALTRRIQLIIEEPSLPPSGTLIMPTFEPGEALYRHAASQSS